MNSSGWSFVTNGIKPGDVITSHQIATIFKNMETKQAAKVNKKQAQNLKNLKTCMHSCTLQGTQSI